MMEKKLPQGYGTQSQTFNSDGKFVLYPVHPTAVSDADRAEAGVPSLEKIKADIEKKNQAANKEPK